MGYAGYGCLAWYREIHEGDHGRTMMMMNVLVFLADGKLFEELIYDFEKLISNFEKLIRVS